MKDFFWLEKLRRGFVKERWTCRRIAFVAILIATSVSLVIVFTKITPIAALPSFKLMAGGLPIKITGYIFGPVIGGITGIISDLLTFLFLPTYYHFFYTMAFAFAGIIPGIVGYIMNRRWKERNEVEKEFSKKISISNYITTIVIISVIIVFFSILPFTSFFEKSNNVNKWVFFAASISGVGTMLIGLILFAFILKPKVLNSILPIIVFSAFLDLVNTPMVALGDIAVLQGGDYSKFMTLVLGHLLLTPMKTWGNMIIILTSYRIISPLIYSKMDNGWGRKIAHFSSKNNYKKGNV